MAFRMLLQIITILLFCVGAHAVSIHINNAGFELDGTLEPNTYAWSTTLLADWPEFDPSNLMPLSYGLGIQNPTNGDAFDDFVFGDNVPEGTNCVYLEQDPVNGIDGPIGIRQTLSDVVQENTKYVLSVYVGSPAANCWADSTDGPMCYESSTFPGYSVILLAGSNILSQDDNSLLIPTGEWRESTVTVDIYPGDINIGQELNIQLINKNLFEDEVAFDDVRLEAVKHTTTTTQPTLSPTESPVSKSPTDIPSQPPTLPPTMISTSNPTTDSNSDHIASSMAETFYPTLSPVAAPNVLAISTVDPTSVSLLQTLSSGFTSTELAAFIETDKSHIPRNESMIEVIFIYIGAASVFVMGIAAVIGVWFKLYHKPKTMSANHQTQMNEMQKVDHKGGNTQNPISSKVEKTKQSELPSIDLEYSGNGAYGGDDSVKHVEEGQQTQGAAQYSTCMQCGDRSKQKMIEMDGTLVCYTCIRWNNDDVDKEVDKMFKQNDDKEGEITSGETHNGIAGNYKVNTVDVSHENVSDGLCEKMTHETRGHW